ncbi:MAG: hypothetical protein LBP75_05130 [Planctomycetota bacterium]|nr:hypothetical protein [Planctomycetota bacterium]
MPPRPRRFVPLFQPLSFFFNKKNLFFTVFFRLARRKSGGVFSVGTPVEYGGGGNKKFNRNGGYANVDDQSQSQ